MTHSDDQGLVLPPKLARWHAVIVPIYFNDDQRTAVLEKAEQIEQQLKDAGLSIHLDDDDTQSPGWKFNEYELQGVPLRIAIGPRDLENDNVELARRDTQEKNIVPQAGLTERVKNLLEEIQSTLYEQALEYREAHTTSVDSYDAFKEVLEEKGGFVLAHWDGTAETEARIKDETSATIRCVPLDREEEPGEDMLTGKPSDGRVIFAKAY